MNAHIIMLMLNIVINLVKFLQLIKFAVSKFLKNFSLNKIIL